MLLILTLVAGCREREQITTRHEPHSPHEMDPEPEPPTSGDPTPARLLGAILPRDGGAWFFKVIGHEAPVAKQAAAVKEFVRKVKFEGREPKWELPKEWRSGTGDAARFATIVLDDEKPPTELAVTFLSGNQDVYENLKRWRGQVNLPDVGKAETLKLAETLQTGGGPAQWVNLEGTLHAKKSGGPMAGMMAGGAGALPAGHPPLGAMPPAAGAAADAERPDLPFQYEAPADWKRGPPSSFVDDAYAVEDAGEKLRVTVSHAGGSLLDNVNRWRTQELQLPPIDEEQLKTAVTKYKVDGHDADFVELVGTATSGKQEVTFVVIVPQVAGTNWFFKMKGDAPLAQRRREQFFKFIQSIRIAS